MTASSGYREIRRSFRSTGQVVARHFQSGPVTGVPAFVTSGATKAVLSEDYERDSPGPSDRHPSRDRGELFASPPDGRRARWS